MNISGEEVFIAQGLSDLGTPTAQDPPRGSGESVFESDIFGCFSPANNRRLAWDYFAPAILLA